jgi:energy-coupling factor transporter ATP-binding protein EcfA2
MSDKIQSKNILSRAYKGIVDYIIPVSETITNKKDNLELIPVLERGLNSLIEFKETYFIEAGEYRRVFGFTDFFGEYLEPSFFSDCLTANLKVSINFKYQVTDKLKSKRKLQSLINDVEKSTNGEFSNSLTATLSHDKIDKMQETIDEANQLINTNKLIDFTLLITLSSPDLDTLGVNTNILQNIAENNGFSITPIIYKQRQALVETSSPDSISNDLKPYQKRLLETNVAPFIPIRSDIRSIENDYIWVGRTRESKQFLTVPFQTSSDLNSHTLILGSTGFGKSTLLKTIILQACIKGMHIVAIDPQGELKQMAILLKGDVKLCGYSQSFKLLNGNLSPEDKEVYIKLLTSYFVKLNNEETLRSYYSACLYELLENTNPTIEEFKILISKKDEENKLNNRLIDSMAVVFKGKLGQMLAGTQDIEISNPFTVFDFSELQSQDHNDDFKSMFLSLFTFVISKAMHERGNKSLFVLDEAYQVLDDENSRDFILKTVKKIRKMNSSVLISMQTLTDYGEAGKNLWSLCNYKFLFRHENTEYLVNHLDLGEIRTVNTFDMGEYMFLNQNKKIVATTIDPSKTPRIQPYITYKSGEKELTK